MGIRIREQTAIKCDHCLCHEASWENEGPTVFLARMQNKGWRWELGGEKNSGKETARSYFLCPKHAEGVPG